MRPEEGHRVTGADYDTDDGRATTAVDPFQGIKIQQS